MMEVIKDHGLFTSYTDPMRPGALMKNADGDDWHRFVLLRVMFDGFGNVAKLYEEDYKTEITADRYFLTVSEDGVVQFVSNGDPSKLEPRNLRVIETDKPVEAGQIYKDNKFHPAPAPTTEPVFVLKPDVVAKFSDEQFEKWDTEYPKATPKQRVMWDNGYRFEYGSPEYQVAQSLFVGIFGKDGYDFFPK